MISSLVMPSNINIAFVVALLRSGINKYRPPGTTFSSVSKEIRAERCQRVPGPCPKEFR